MSKILLSLCIPTNGRIEILKNTLDSIYTQTDDYSEFEIVISDNSKTDELQDLLVRYKNIPNIKWEKCTSEGFLNSVNALKMGSGEFLKLLNNYSMIKNGSLEKMISFIKENEKMKSQLFFSSNNLHGVPIKRFDNFNDFMYGLSYWSSWSTGFCIWKSDFDKLNRSNNFSYNKMFPHTSLLFSLHDKNSYVIDDESLFDNQEVQKKGDITFSRFLV